MLVLDHIAVAALTIEEGVAYAENALAVKIPKGGAHAFMATHNHLLQMGEGIYLEVIAPDPEAAPINRARWFSLDDAEMQKRLKQSPRLVTWIASTTDIDSALRDIPGAAGPALHAQRGELRWKIGVADDGLMPFGGAFPTLIEWPGGQNPAHKMADHGLRFVELLVEHPEADAIARSLSSYFRDERVRFAEAEQAKLTATFDTPQGLRRLS
jgi:hypothetical protein